MNLSETFTHPSMMHAAVVHMPIVFALLGIPLVYYLAVSHQRTDTLRWVTVGFFVLAAAFAYAAMLSGRAAMELVPNNAAVSSDTWKIIGQHEEMGERVWQIALITALFLALSVIRVRIVRQIFTAVAMLLVLVLGVWITMLGHFGGTLVYLHGVGTPNVHDASIAHADPVAVVAPAVIDSGASGMIAAPTDTFQPVARLINLNEAKKISFNRDVKPILEQSCKECHNPDKMRGDFDCTTIAAMIAGGKKGGPGIVPGKPDESSLVTYIRGVVQPQMPKGEDPLTEDQLHLIRQWIAAGAVDDSVEAAPSAPQVEAPATAPAAETAPAPAQATSAADPQPAPGPASVPPAAEAAPAPAPAAPATDVVATSPAPVAPAPAPAAPAPAAEPTPAASAASIDGAPSVEQLLFSAGPEELLVTRRNYRMSLVPKPGAPFDTDVPANNEIDKFVAAKWKSIDPAFQGSVCDDATFARRAYLDVIGMIPKADEVRAFTQDPAPDKRAKLVDALLARDGDYAAHWTPFWEDALCSNGNHQGGVGTRGNYRDWIFNSFKANKPFDVFAAELLDPHMPNHPERYVLRQDQTRILKSAADTAQVFLGTTMKCAQCHNHFENKEWTQRRFIGMAGFFADKDVEVVKCEAHTGEFVPTNFVFDMPGVPKDVPTTEDARIARFAQLLVDPCNPRFAKTVVNRLWKRFLGTGLFEPADDFRLEVPASHPELLDWLAYDFMANGFDIKHTMRLILNSRTYQLKYDAALEDHYDVAKPGAPRYYRSPRLRRMTAEQLLDSVKVALGEPLSDDKREYRSDESTPLTRALGRPSTRNEVSTARAEDSAVVQTLELLNGDEFYGRIYDASFVASESQRVRDAGDADGVMNDLYWATLGRAPADAERAAGAEFVKGAVVDANAPQIVDVALADDALPEGAKADGSSGAESWKWVSAPSAPVFSGSTAAKLTAPPAPAPSEITPAPSPTPAAPENPAPSQPEAAPAAPQDAPAPAAPPVPANVETTPPDTTVGKFAANTNPTTQLSFAVNAPANIQLAEQAETPVTAPSEPVSPPASPAPAAEAAPAVPQILEQNFSAMAQPLVVSADDVLYVYVYLEPSDAPKSIMIQWRVGESWDHRALWGDTSLKNELGDGPQRLNMGALPEAGKWVRLEVPAYRLGLGKSGTTVNGISIVQLGGTAYWDKSGVLSAPLGGPTSAVGDALWALISSPEFQYIR